MIALINSPFLVHSSYELTLSIFPIKVRAKMKAALLFEARDALLSLTLTLALALALSLTLALTLTLTLTLIQDSEEDDQQDTNNTNCHYCGELGELLCPD